MKQPLTEFNAGGSHEENPNGGIPMGEAGGVTNTVEEDETKITIGDSQYVFSNRLSTKSNYLSLFYLPTYVAKKTFAEASKAIEQRFKDRNDNASNSTKNELMKRLTEAQEQAKLEREANEMGITLDELLELKAEQARAEAEAASAAQQQQENPGQEPVGEDGLPLSPEEISAQLPAIEGTEELGPQLAYGGRIRKFDLAGALPDEQDVIEGTMPPELPEAEAGKKGTGAAGIIAGGIGGAISIGTNMASALKGESEQSIGGAALSGAATGAAAGAVAGPPGMLIGAAVGGILQGGAAILGKDKKDAKELRKKVTEVSNTDTEDARLKYGGKVRMYPDGGSLFKDGFGGGSFGGGGAGGRWDYTKEAEAEMFKQKQETDRVAYALAVERGENPEYGPITPSPDPYSLGPRTSTTAGPVPYDHSFNTTYRGNKYTGPGVDKSDIGLGKFNYYDFEQLPKDPNFTPGLPQVTGEGGGGAYKPSRVDPIFIGSKGINGGDLKFDLATGEIKKVVPDDYDPDVDGPDAKKGIDWTAYGSAAAQLAPFIGNMIEGANLRKAGPNKYRRAGRTYLPNFADERKKLNLLDESFGGTEGAIANATAGNLGAYRANLLGSQINKARARAQAFSEMNEINRQEISNQNADFANAVKEDVALKNREILEDRQDKSAYDSARKEHRIAAYEGLAKLGETIFGVNQSADLTTYNWLTGDKTPITPKEKAEAATQQAEADANQKSN